MAKLDLFGQALRFWRGEKTGVLISNDYTAGLPSSVCAGRSIKLAKVLPLSESDRLFENIAFASLTSPK